MSTPDDPDKKPPPQPTVAWNPDDVPGVGGDAEDAAPEAPKKPPPQPTVAWNPDDVPAPQPTIPWSAEELAKMAAEEAASEAADTEEVPQEDPLVGTLMRNKWRILKRLGAGSFGTVYKVEDVKGGWIEALKILGVDRLAGAEAEEMRKRFLREAQIMKRLGTESQHIVGLATYEEDIEAGLIYFLMEFVEGKSLGAALKEQGPFTVERTVRIAIQACDGLMAAHEGPEPVVHRDLKLENLMLTKDREGEEIVKILDFGIAKIAEREADSRLTTVGTLGTPGYAAPEQLRAEEVDGRTDLFAFGVILYALLTGRDPWLGKIAYEPTDQIYELMAASDRAEVLPMAGTGVSVPPAMASIVLRLLRRDPAERFQSARELSEALQRVTTEGAGEAVGSLRVVTTEPGVKVEVRSGREIVAAGPTPCVATGIPAGTYTILVRDPRYQQAESEIVLGAGATEEVTLSTTRREASRAVSRRGRGRLVFLAMVAGLLLYGAYVLQPLGRTLDLPTLRGHIQDRAVARMWLGDGGLGGYLLVGPLELVSPFFMTVLEGEIPEIVAEFRAAGMYVDTSSEARRLRDLAVAAQAVSQYYGLEGGDVRTYALRLADLQPQSREAASLLLKVGEHMAWDAEVALEEGPGGRAEELIDQCLELVPDHPRCLAVSLEG